MFRLMQTGNDGRGERRRDSRWGTITRRGMVAPLACALALPAAGASAQSSNDVPEAQAAAAATAPNIFFYNLDDLRDAFPGGIDPLQYMPNVRSWMANGTRFQNTSVTTPACTPSRAAMMTGRYAHNNGVQLQSQGGSLDTTHTAACYLDNAGYQTYEDGKFLTTWPKTKRPPCYDHSTVIWGGYNDVASKVDGVAKKTSGYSTTVLGVRGREYINQALTTPSAPFFLYETPQAPHWVNTTVGGQAVRLAVPDTKYANAPVGTCSGVPEADRSDKPAWVRKTNFTTAQAQQMCTSQMRAIMTADDEFGATMQLLQDKGVLANTLVIFTSDNGYNWGEHGRTEKFAPYEPSLHVPLWIRWPGHVSAGVNTSRIVSYIDIAPTILSAAGLTLPAGAPRMDGESLLEPSTRTSFFGEYYKDSANGGIETWKTVRTPTDKLILTYDASGNVTFREYYNLTTDPAENTNTLGDSSTTNDPPAARITTLTNLLNSYKTCAGTACVK